MSTTLQPFLLILAPAGMADAADAARTQQVSADEEVLDQQGQLLPRSSVMSCLMTRTDYVC